MEKIWAGNRLVLSRLVLNEYFRDKIINSGALNCVFFPD